MLKDYPTYRFPVVPQATIPCALLSSDLASPFAQIPSLPFYDDFTYFPAFLNKFFIRLLCCVMKLVERDGGSFRYTSLRLLDQMCRRLRRFLHFLVRGADQGICNITNNWSRLVVKIWKTSYRKTEPIAVPLPFHTHWFPGIMTIYELFYDQEDQAKGRFSADRSGPSSTSTRCLFLPPSLLAL